MRKNSLYFYLLDNASPGVFVNFPLRILTLKIIRNRFASVDMRFYCFQICRFHNADALYSSISALMLTYIWIPVYVKKGWYALKW